ncbi:MAG: PilT/PilU family type 4a pilus ATPase [Spirochaetia bacterium]|nr:PilT/PilU family type 4a pilus ATPase [Spirochaetia bacterium]
MTCLEILTEAVTRGASDALIVAGLPVSLKINGRIYRDEGKLHPQDTLELIRALYGMADRDITPLEDTGDDDFSFSVSGLSRFRVNAFRQRGSFAAVVRTVSFHLPNRAALGIPDIVMDLAQRPHGLVLITGSAGCGKTTTLACMVDEINSTRESHVITIEDPIEYLHQHKCSVVTQRELYTDTKSYAAALRAALREAPDVILVGEMRDSETIKAAVTAAETGHLVISTLHTIGAANTVDRIVDVFPPEQQHQIRTQLSLVLEGVVSQQLLSARDGALVPAFEIMTATPAVRNILREAKAHQLDNILSTSSELGMTTMDQSILALIRSGRVAVETAMRFASNPEWLSRRLSESGTWVSTD